MNTGTVLVTGAHGFIGRHVAGLYGERGWRVTAMGHGVWPRSEWRQWHISEWHACDITIETLLAYGGNPDVIVHCAGSGSVGFSVRHPFQDYQRTVETFLQVLEFVRLHAPLTRVVYPSSAGVYGIAGSQPISEDIPLHPISPYGVNKKIAEELCRSYGLHFGVSSAIVRLFSAYGEGLRKQLLWDACVKVSKNDTLFSGTGEETRDMIHVTDAAELVFTVSCQAAPDSPVVNGGSGIGTTVRQILSDLFEELGRQDSPCFDGVVRAGDPAHYAADIRKARSMGWRPKKDLRSGIAEYAQWYITQRAAGNS